MNPTTIETLHGIRETTRQFVFACCRLNKSSNKKVTSETRRVLFMLTSSAALIDQAICRQFDVNNVPYIRCDIHSELQYALYGNADRIQELSHMFEYTTDVVVQSCTSLVAIQTAFLLSPLIYDEKRTNKENSEGFDEITRQFLVIINENFFALKEEQRSFFTGKDEYNDVCVEGALLFCDQTFTAVYGYHTHVVFQHMDKIQGFFQKNISLYWDAVCECIHAGKVDARFTNIAYDLLSIGPLGSVEGILSLVGPYGEERDAQYTPATEALVSSMGLGLPRQFIEVVNLLNQEHYKKNGSKSMTSLAAMIKAYFPIETLSILPKTNGIMGKIGWNQSYPKREQGQIKANDNGGLLDVAFNRVYAHYQMRGTLLCSLDRVDVGRGVRALPNEEAEKKFGFKNGSFRRDPSGTLEGHRGAIYNRLNGQNVTRKDEIPRNILVHSVLTSLGYDNHYSTVFSLYDKTQNSFKMEVESAFFRFHPFFSLALGRLPQNALSVAKIKEYVEGEIKRIIKYCLLTPDQLQLSPELHKDLVKLVEQLLVASTYTVTHPLPGESRVANPSEIHPVTQQSMVIREALAEIYLKDQKELDKFTRSLWRLVPFYAKDDVHIPGLFGGTHTTLLDPIIYPPCINQKNAEGSKALIRAFLQTQPNYGMFPVACKVIFAVARRAAADRVPSPFRVVSPPLPPRVISPPFRVISPPVVVQSEVEPPLVPVDTPTRVRSVSPPQVRSVSPPQVVEVPVPQVRSVSPPQVVEVPPSPSSSSNGGSSSSGRNSSPASISSVSGSSFGTVSSSSSSEGRSLNGGSSSSGRNSLLGSISSVSGSSSVTVSSFSGSSRSSISSDGGYRVHPTTPPPVEVKIQKNSVHAPSPVSSQTSETTYGSARSSSSPSSGNDYETASETETMKNITPAEKNAGDRAERENTEIFKFLRGRGYQPTTNPPQQPMQFTKYGQYIKDSEVWRTKELKHAFPDMTVIGGMPIPPSILKVLPPPPHSPPPLSVSGSQIQPPLGPPPGLVPLSPRSSSSSGSSPNPPSVPPVSRASPYEAPFNNVTAFSPVPQKMRFQPPTFIASKSMPPPAPQQQPQTPIPGRRVGTAYVTRIPASIPSSVSPPGLVFSPSPVPLGRAPPPDVMRPTAFQPPAAAKRPAAVQLFSGSPSNSNRSESVQSWDSVDFAHTRRGFSPIDESAGRPGSGVPLSPVSFNPNPVAARPQSAPVGRRRQQQRPSSVQSVQSEQSEQSTKSDSTGVSSRSGLDNLSPAEAKAVDVFRSGWASNLHLPTPARYLPPPSPHGPPGASSLKLVERAKEYERGIEKVAKETGKEPEGRKAIGEIRLIELNASGEVGGANWTEVYDQASAQMKATFIRFMEAYAPKATKEQLNQVLKDFINEHFESVDRCSHTDEKENVRAFAKELALVMQKLMLQISNPLFQASPEWYQGELNQLTANLQKLSALLIFVQFDQANYNALIQAMEREIERLNIQYKAAEAAKSPDTVQIKARIKLINDGFDALENRRHDGTLLDAFIKVVRDKLYPSSPPPRVAVTTPIQTAVDSYLSKLQELLRRLQEEMAKVDEKQRDPSFAMHGAELIKRREALEEARMMLVAVLHQLQTDLTSKVPDTTIILRVIAELEKQLNDDTIVDNYKTVFAGVPMAPMAPRPTVRAKPVRPPPPPPPSSTPLETADEIKDSIAEKAVSQFEDPGDQKLRNENVPPTSGVLAIRRWWLLRCHYEALGQALRYIYSTNDIEHLRHLRDEMLQFQLPEWFTVTATGQEILPPVGTVDPIGVFVKLLDELTPKENTMPHFDHLENFPVDCRVDGMIIPVRVPVTGTPIGRSTRRKASPPGLPPPPPPPSSSGPPPPSSQGGSVKRTVPLRRNQQNVEPHPPHNSTTVPRGGSSQHFTPGQALGRGSKPKGLGASGSGLGTVGDVTMKKFLGTVHASVAKGGHNHH